MTDRDEVASCDYCQYVHLTGLTHFGRRRIMLAAGGPDCKNPQCPHKQRKNK